MAHQVVVRTNQPIRQNLHLPDLVRKIVKWAIKLSEFDIKFESRSTLKSQVLADFMAEMTLDVDDQVEYDQDYPCWWLFQQQGK